MNKTNNDFKLKVIIVDDEAISREVIRNYVQQTAFMELVGEGENAIQASEILRNHEIDCILLDVEMPGMSGLELINVTRQLPEVIIISCNKNYAIEAFEYDVADYMVKPVKYPRFFKGAQKVRDRISTRHQANLKEQGTDQSGLESSIFVRSDGKLTKITLKDITYIEAYGDYVLIHTPKQRYAVHTTMKTMEKNLDGPHFMRVHRSYIVKLEEISSIDEGIISVNSRLIPLGKSYKSRLIEKLNLLS